MMDNAHTGLRSAAVFALCGLFAVLAVGLAVLSGGVYQAAARESDENYTRRTALSYLVNQVRRADAVGGVAVGRFGGSDALVLTEEVEGTEYVTLLYCYEGQLRELYAEADSGLGPGDGLPVLELDGLELEVSGGRIACTVLPAGGEPGSVSVFPRCGVEEVGEL